MKRLILIRHAHRETFDRALDNGLSEKGWEQARALLEISRRELSHDDRQNVSLWSSAKLRCQETLDLIAQDLDHSVHVDPDLFEQRDTESAAEFLDRAARLLSRIQKDGPHLLLACSHGDLIPLLIRQAVGLQASVKKASWTELLWSGHEWTLKRLIQDIQDEASRHAP